MLVEETQPATCRDIDVLWVSNIRREKRPDRILELAQRLPEARIHMVGGSLPDEESLFRDVKQAAAARSNVSFHGRLSYWGANRLYGRAKLLVNTSDVEGFPNSYLQAWIRGVPVVTLIDPDRSEEHTSELQSHSELVCRLLLEKKKLEVCLTNDSTSI